MKGLIPFVLLFLIVYANQTEAEEKSYSYEKMLNDAQTLEVLYPEIIKVDSIGESEWGNNIPCIYLGKGKESILLIGTHHAREWITTQFLMELVKEYAAGYEKEEQIGEYSAKLLDDISLVIVPMLNPDGVMIQQNGLQGHSIIKQLKLWRMNHFSRDFKRWKANGLGIDLNRQYPADWGALKKWPAWSSYKQYRGKEPIQAKEVKEVVSFTQQLKPILSLTYHTSGQEVYWYYQTPKENIVRDYVLAKQIGKMTGYELGLPESDAVGGGYTDWFITTFQRPAFTIEMCELVKETNPPNSCLHDEYNRNVAVPLMLIHEILKQQ